MIQLFGDPSYGFIGHRRRGRVVSTPRLPDQRRLAGTGSTVHIAASLIVDCHR
jgi:hypothetical protein